MKTELAREILLAHAKSKKNGVFPDETNVQAELANPICGDYVEIKLNYKLNEIITAGFKASACAICSASASILSQMIVTMKKDQVLDVCGRLEEALTVSPDLDWPSHLDGLACFEHLRVNPARKMCVLLPWVAVKSALLKSKP